MAETWYTADPHLGHERIITLANRPFKDVAHMNAEIVRRWNSVVMPDDTVWVLGDVVMGPFERTIELIASLNGRLILFPGNHDRTSLAYGSSLTRRNRFRATYERYFARVVDENIDAWHKVINEHPVLLSHFPYVGDSHEGDRFKHLRPKDEGLPLVHGHVHEAWLENGRQLNVGMDVWDFTPVPEAGVAGWLEQVLN